MSEQEKEKEGGVTKEQSADGESEAKVKISRMSQVSRRFLCLDLRRLLQRPLKDLRIAILNDDIQTLAVNMYFKQPGEKFDTALLHMHLAIPLNYPTKEPGVEMMTRHLHTGVMGRRVCFSLDNFEGENASEHILFNMSLSLSQFLRLLWEFLSKDEDAEKEKISYDLDEVRATVRSTHVFICPDPRCSHRGAAHPSPDIPVDPLVQQKAREALEGPGRASIEKSGDVTGDSGTTPAAAAAASGCRETNQPVREGNAVEETGERTQSDSASQCAPTSPSGSIHTKTASEQKNSAAAAAAEGLSPPPPATLETSGSCESHKQKVGEGPSL
uniref:Uncharacterized protein n=1 Tax=Chromera velia CCMP2878 TaxID=1169474 RepID=A0A0G4I7F3_9ALVE|eukprot:Cvel_11608.t1-p1 / transcript=Cvel_11608.t1 / gene=Cvel_11608 / organism=Chromera_velia_CCMP2878 / gene_product=hypothetical protein / transcript_product=hypothetical protein / location=Cvel_scaffold735:17411-18797(-) / protein_length=328 / sequence_SO=supercontig / SO=protein_coding / is_pseudo=false